MKGIIIAAGYGSRFFPITKAVPKEMLPLIDRPAIDFIVEEFHNSGINDILIITSRKKKSIEDYFDRDPELENILSKEGKQEQLRSITPRKGSFYYIRQQEMKGTGHAILLAKSFVGNEPFVVAYPDDLHFGEIPLSLQLINKHNETGCSVLGTIHNPRNLERYGIIALDTDNVHVTDIVEKPAPGTEPSKEATIGRYLFTPEIFTLLEQGLANHKKGEFYHIDAIRSLAKAKKLVFIKTTGTRLDIGEPAGYLEAVFTYARMMPGYEDVLSQIYLSLKRMG
ncbi:MAG: UTP--glucose-1-phosphate uridylyltransferase [Spirochaetales bacterium]|nr:UTP--glucose-1-phosphate uridylyltransferase [Spirochaetales bacterium]